MSAGRDARGPRRMQGRAAFTALGGVVALLVGACGSGGGDGGGSTAGRSPEDPPTVVISAYSSYVLDPAVEARVEEDLGVRIEVLTTGDSGEVLASALLTAGRPDADILFGVDDTSLASALAGDLFTVVDVPNRALLPEQVSAAADPAVLPIDTSAVCIDFDSSWFVERELAPPDSLEDLVRPEYRGLLVLPSPVTSSPGLVFLAGVHQRLGTGAPAFLERLRANEALVTGGWDEAFYTQYSVSGGDHPLVLSYSTSPPAEVYFSEGRLTESSTGVVTSTCVTQTEYAGVLRGAREPTAAAKVLNAMLDTDWQESIPLSNFVLPIRPDVPVTSEYGPFVRPEGALELDADLIAAEGEAWLSAWRELFE